MRIVRNFVLAACPPMVVAMLLVGCSQPQPAPPASTPTPTAEAEPATPAEKAGPFADAAASVQAPSTPEAVAEKLPEVLAVNTAKLGGLVERTLGKVTVINIWATWCGPCIYEIPEFVQFYSEMDRDATAFLSLSVDEEEDITSAIPKFQREHKVPFPIYVLNERNDEGLLKALRGTFGGGIPTTFFYDREGKIVKKLDGAITLAQIRAIVNPLLATNP